MPHPPERLLEARLEGGDPIYVGIGRRRWLEVFVRRTQRHGAQILSNEYRHYGFDRVEKRWSHGDAPVGAREIRQLLAPLL